MGYKKKQTLRDVLLLENNHRLGCDGNSAPRRCLLSCIGMPPCNLFLGFKPRRCIFFPSLALLYVHLDVWVLLQRWTNVQGQTMVAASNAV